MPRKPRVTGRSLDPCRLEIAERLHRLARAASGPDVTFEHQQDVAAAVAAEALAELWKAEPDPAAGTGGRGEAG